MSLVRVTLELSLKSHNKFVYFVKFKFLKFIKSFFFNMVALNERNMFI